MRRIFLFRPEPGARHSADRARDMGLQTAMIPLFEIERLDWAAPDPADYDAMLLTSANALRFAGEQVERLRSLAVHAVGETTAVAARVAGFGVATVGDAGVEALLGALEPGERLLHLCGEDRRMPQVTAQRITSVPVYRARPVASPPGLDRLSGQVAALHSPRAAARLAELVSEAERGTVRVAAISATAASAAGTGWERLETAPKPTDSALLALAARLCDS